MNDHEFGENSAGIHLISVVGNGMTICGDVEEGDAPCDIEPLRETKARVVTCPECIRIIEYCRGVRTNKKAVSR